MAFLRNCFVTKNDLKWFFQSQINKRNSNKSKEYIKENLPARIKNVFSRKDKRIQDFHLKYSNLKLLNLNLNKVGWIHGKSKKTGSHLK